MLTDRKIVGKLEKIEARYEALRFVAVAEVPMEIGETRAHCRSEPADLDWRPCPPGTAWGDDWMTAWFRGTVTLPDDCHGQRVFVRIRTGGEQLLWVDGQCRGCHEVELLALEGRGGRQYRLAVEAYAGHSFPGTQPDESGVTVAPGARRFGGGQLVRERELVTAFVYDLRVLRQLLSALDDNSLRRHRVLAGLAQVFAAVDAMPAEQPESQWLDGLVAARAAMAPLLAARNGTTAPWFALIGHSHIDTAWLWPLAETWRKCARTFSSVLNLMEQYPEFLFVQSTPCHAWMMRQEYPELFARLQARVREGRWEPNGAMWVEPDTNLPGGESLVRQLVLGQQATREMFGYTADTLWLPDVFGYSAALPQLLRLSGVEFFCTSKIAWNDTTRFPHQMFVWRGIDGSSVLAHFHSIHCWPDPQTLAAQWQDVPHKEVQDRRLCPFGYGDGGGGPQAEMLEVARRVADLERRQQRALSRRALVRFDNDAEVSGKLSFALALLDEKGHGFVLTSLYNLQGNRLFLRPVRGGQVERELLPEEAQALQKALQGEE